MRAEEAHESLGVIHRLSLGYVGPIESQFAEADVQSPISCILPGFLTDNEVQDPLGTYMYLLRGVHHASQCGGVSRHSYFGNPGYTKGLFLHLQL